MVHGRHKQTTSPSTWPNKPAPSGKAGDTIGTLICTDFGCSRNVRRPPTRSEVGGNDAEAMRGVIVERRIGELRERSARFVDEVRSTR